MLVFKQHEAHAEEDAVEVPIFGRLIAFHRLIEDPDLIIEVPSADERAAVIEVAFVDVDAGDMKVLCPDEIMVFLDHDPVADPHIQDARMGGKIFKTVFIAYVGDVVDYELIQNISHFKPSYVDL
jgi:hypothetical protein